MKKIEKLNMFVPEIEKEHYLAILNIANKLDELVEALNQSQKQPEGWRDITVGQLMEDKKKAVEFLKNNPDFLKEAKSDKESLAFQSLVKPEKQGEWRKNVQNDKSGIVYNGRNISDADDFIEVVSQLLSERTFSEKELKHIKSCVKYRWTTLHPKKPRTELKRKILVKIDNLLKKEE